MSLISVSFVIFLPLTVLVNFMLPKKQRYIWLFFSSYVFYLSNDVRYAVGLLFCTASTYGAGLLLERKDMGGKRILLGLCVAVNGAALLFFRYSSFGAAIAPIGISFYMLQAVGYVIDVYRGRAPAEKNPLKYALFVSFFPTVISGPIQRAGGLLAQIGEGRDFDYQKAHSGLYHLLGGYLLKFVMADRLGMMVGQAYDNYQTMPGATLLWATVLYAIQLYCDFAGYSSLAVGAAKMLGFDIGINFSQPYFATSVKDFWNRWHQPFFLAAGLCIYSAGREQERQSPEVWEPAAHISVQRPVAWLRGEFPGVGAAARNLSDRGRRGEWRKAEERGGYRSGGPHGRDAAHVCAGGFRMDFFPGGIPGAGCGHHKTDFLPFRFP